MPSQPKKIKRKYRIKPEERERRRQAVQQARAELPVEITLKVSHIINGQSYGPGKITVNGSLAKVLLDDDRRAGEAEENFRGTKAVIIGPQVRGVHTTKQVPIETFDTSLNNSPEAIQTPSFK